MQRAHRLLLGAFPAPIILGRRLDVGMPSCLCTVLRATSLQSWDRYHHLVEIVGQPLLQLIKDVMLGRRINSLMPQRLLCLANITLGELGADETPEVMRLDVAQADLIGIALYRTPHVDGDPSPLIPRRRDQAVPGQRVDRGRDRSCAGHNPP